MLVKVTPVINFTSILQQPAYVQIFYRRKNAKPNSKKRKAEQHNSKQKICS